MRNSVIERITKEAGKKKDIFLITGDAGFGVLDNYKKSFPERFLNLGVAEQNMIGMASGLGLSGFKVFVYNIVPFVLYRCYEQVRNDICYQNVPVTLIGIGSGVTYSPQGVTHYSVEDIALARTLPNLVILSPSDPIEAVKCAEYAIKSKDPVYIRIAKSGEPVIHTGRVKDITRPVVLNEGEGVAVLFHGSVSTEVVSALKGVDRRPKAVSVPMLQPMDFSSLEKELKAIHTIITVEEHFVEGGLGSIIAEWIVSERLDYRLIKLGIKNEFIHKITNNAGMRSHYGISSEGIKGAIEKAYGNG
ncbi:MAG: transketolase C-terminal domain-containing protein [Thermodesulfovibrionales bacterium]|nr:transketolase C-terminal domain-containing protein [Thermodesulfovibrionales bacterium]